MGYWFIGIYWYYCCVNTQSWLSWFLRGILFLVFILLFAKLFELQIIKGNYYRALAEENRIKHIIIPAPRGKILARGGQELSGPDFAHTTGYLAKVNDKEIGTVDPDCPEKGVRKSQELVGRTGLQERYDCILKGVDGEELVEVNTVGETLRILAKKDPINGSNLKTTIDFDLQKQAALELKDKKGAIIATDIRGQILAFYSAPSFDPLNLSKSLTDKELPFFNRAIGGTFHPGSVFKPLVALAALENGAINKDYNYIDTGQIVVNDFSYTNWYFTQYGRTEGSIDLTRALARSTDTFFYKIGELTGPDKIADMGNKFEVSKKTGIDIDGEVEGLIPTPDWKKKVKKENWFLGNTYHMSIGQGDVALTPIEVNQFIAAIAANGQVCPPHFLLDSSTKCKKIDLKKENFDLVKEGMKKACQDGGTAYTFFDFSKKYNTDIACKTGTAEVGTADTTHAWFTLFSPIENPQIVLTVLVENGGEGSKVAGPIARSIMNRWQLIQNP